MKFCYPRHFFLPSTFYPRSRHFTLALDILHSTLDLGLRPLGILLNNHVNDPHRAGGLTVSHFHDTTYNSAAILGVTMETNGNYRF